MYGEEIYDLSLKLEGVKALIGGEITDDSISTSLFEHLYDDPQERRSHLSRMKSGLAPVRLTHRVALSDDFNGRINRFVRPAGGASRPIEPEHWLYPVPDFFSTLGAELHDVPDALHRAHSGLLDAMLSFGRYRETGRALTIKSMVNEGNSTPIQENAPLQSIEAPVVQVRAGMPMTIIMDRAACSEPARVWIFEIRNPGCPVWGQDLTQMVSWCGGPTEVPAGFIGDLQGFPSPAPTVVGTTTVFALSESLASTAVADLLARPTPGWDRTSAPSFEGYCHMVTRAMQLFQRGNTKKYVKGELPCPPPKLHMARYQVGPENPD